MLPGDVVGVERFGGGHINDSWRLTAADGSCRSRFLLQRINGRVFPRPDLLMENCARVTAHLARAFSRTDVPDAERRALTLVPTRDGAAAHVDAGGAYWRTFPFIEGTVARERTTRAEDAYQAARAFGRFQRLLRDYPGPRLHETIADFHDTPRRLEALVRAAAADRYGRCDAARPEVEVALRHRPLASALLERHRRGEVPERVVHNDAKIANVLLDAATGEGLCVVDLDTVMPGLALYDFGDMARSMASAAPEDATDLAAVAVRADLFQGLAGGYLDGAGDLLSATERGLLVTAARVITYEQAVRFLTDYLDGDRYYRTSRPAHNLERSRAQFALLDAFTRAEPVLARVVTRL